MTNNWKYWIVTDMDDTLIKHYEKVSNKVKNLWNELRKDSKNCLVVATGQSHVKVIEKFRANGLKLPDYIISNQGSVIYSTEDRKIKQVFTLVYNQIMPLLDHFLKIGGEEKFIRVCTLNKVIAFDCKEAREFYRKNPQSNVEFSPEISKVIEQGEYTKLVLSAPLEIVEEMLNYPTECTGMTVLNSGSTNYGSRDYYRLEIVAANKCVGLLSVFALWRYCSGPYHMICLGDEISDYGLARVALANNLWHGQGGTGYFAIINSEGKGNKELRREVVKLAKNLNCEDRLIFVPSVEDDGWDVAISKWKEKLNIS